MKKAMIFSYMILIVVLFAGCGANTLSETQIKDDIVAKENLTRFDALITGYTVIKRQTNQAEKEDIIYISISGENDDYSFTKNYVATYYLYNDGWRLEYINPYNDSENGIIDSVVPKHGVEDPMYYIEDYIGNTGLELFASYPDDVYSMKLQNLQHGETDLQSNYSVDTYYLDVRYDYYAFTETAQIPIDFIFDTFANDEWSWSMYINESAASRSLLLNDGIVGKWTSHYTGDISLSGNSTSQSNMYFQNWGADIYISSYTGNTCIVDSYERVYSNASYTTQGIIELYYIIDNTTGKIDWVSFHWVDDVPNSNYCSEPRFYSQNVDYMQVDDYCLANVGTEYYQSTPSVSTQTSEKPANSAPELTVEEIRSQVLFAIDACLDNPSSAQIDETYLSLTTYKNMLAKMEGLEFEDCHYIENICDGLAASDFLWVSDDSWDYVEYIYDEGILELCLSQEGNPTYPWETEFFRKLIAACIVCEEYDVTIGGISEYPKYEVEMFPWLIEYCEKMITAYNKILS